MTLAIDLFTVDEFSAYGKYAEAVVTELNKILADESNDKTNTEENPLHQLKTDILNNPNVYLSEDLVGKLYAEQHNNMESTRPTPNN